jgi:hypothetical protein
MRDVDTKSVESGDSVELTRDDEPSSSAAASFSAEQAHHVATRATRFKLWPEGALGPRLRIKEVNLICWALASVFVVLPVSILLWNHVKTGEGFDFVYFYGAGLLSTERPITNLYDYASQQRVFNEISYLKQGHYGPSPYPPFVALFFGMFTKLPFKAAYALWLAISLTLYCAGIIAACKAAFPRQPVKASLALCFALAYPPFLLFTLVNGQLASVAVACVGLALYLQSRGKPFSSGVALSLLVYKPTLLVLLLPMLIVTRRMRALMGFLCGACALGLISTILAGPQIWPAYVRFVAVFRQLSLGHANGIAGQLKRWQFVDLSSLSYAIPAARSAAGLAILLCLTLVVAICLAVLLWKSAHAGKPAQYLAWAITLTWTLLLNVYVPIYDSILVVIAVVLTLGALEALHDSSAERGVVVLSVVLYAVSWKSRAFAESHGIQLLTIMLLILGVIQASLLRRAIKNDPAGPNEGTLS